MSRQLWTTALAVLTLALSVRAQDGSLEERLRRIEEENARIQRELAETRRKNSELETEIRDLRTETTDLREGREAWADGLLEERINALSIGLQDGAWTTATKSRLALRFYGFIRFDTYFNSGRFDDPVIPTRVLAEGGGTRSNDSQFAFDSRLTRFGLELDAGRIGAADVTARLETDFANFPAGVPESRETPRIRLAYINLDFGDVTVRLGQDWDVIAPLHPAVDSETLLWRAGNLGDRRPQAQLVWETGDPEGTTFTVELAAGLTGAVDALDLDGPGGRTNIDGFDSGHPHLQGRVALGFESWVDGKRGAIGLWGFVSRLESDTKFAGDDDFTPYAIGLDVNLPLFGAFSLISEVWYGQALSDMRGTIGQTINTATGDEIAGWGGWVELHWQVTEDLRLAIGGSLDDPKDGDLQAPNPMAMPPVPAGQDRRLNWTTYVSSKLNLGGGLVTGLDVIYWETQYLGGLGNAVRANYWIQLNF